MMKLHLLGVNGPYPASNGATSGYLLEAGDSLFQFDLGSGVLSRLTALMPPEELTALFLTHWHFDHAADLPVLMYRLESLGAVLPVYAPADENAALRKIVQAASCFQLSDVAPGDVLTLGNTEIRVCEARHPVPAVGYRVSQGGKSLGYTGDTNTLPGLRISIGSVISCWRMVSFPGKTGRKGNRISPRSSRPGWPSTQRFLPW